jgi:RNA polymerase sigma-70 factor (ECF subfamily)
MNAPGSDPSAELLRRALAAERDAVRELVASLVPVIRARAVFAMRRRAAGARRAVAQEVDDLTQEVLVSLFADDAYVLRTWDPARGLSLRNFVGLVSCRQINAILSTGKRSPWTEEPTSERTLEHGAGASDGPEPVLASREVLARVVERLRDETSPRGMYLFHALVVEERSIDSVKGELGMSADAAYAWRSRLLKRARAIAKELDGDAVVSDSRPAPATRTGDAAR